METYSAIRVGARRPIFKVTLDDAANGRELAADLVVAASKKLNGNQ